MNPCIFSILLALHCMVCAGLGKARSCRHLHEVFGSLRAGLMQSFAVCLICVSWLLQETLSLPMDVVFDTDHKDYWYKLYYMPQCFRTYCCQDDGHGSSTDRLVVVEDMWKLWHLSSTMVFLRLAANACRMPVLSVVVLVLHHCLLTWCQLLTLGVRSLLLRQWTVVCFALHVCMYVYIYIYMHCVCQGGTAATTWTSALGATAAEVSCCDWFALTTIMSEIFHCRSLTHDVAYQVPTAGAAPPSLMAPALGDTAAEVSCFHWLALTTFISFLHNYFCVCLLVVCQQHLRCSCRDCVFCFCFFRVDHALIA